jgi:ribose/xylose/arabinose/galactoside ABC-type transport system permease subunit
MQRSDEKWKRVFDTCLFPVCLLVIYVICGLLTQGAYFSFSAFNLLVSNSMYMMFQAWGVLFIFSTAPDFSTAAAYALAANLAIYASQEMGLGYVGLILAPILLMIVLQLISTILRIKTKLPMWTFAIGMCLVYEAFGTYYTSARSAANKTTLVLLDSSLRKLSAFPLNFILIGLGLAVAYLFYCRTSIGINYRAVLSNEKVSGYMGIQSFKSLILASIVGAAFFGFGAAVQIAMQGQIIPSSNLGSFGFINKALCAWILSISLSKKINQPFGVMLGAFFICLIFNAMTRLGVPSGTIQDAVLGAILLFFAILPAILDLRVKRKERAA